MLCISERALPLTALSGLVYLTGLTTDLAVGAGTLGKFLLSILLGFLTTCFLSGPKVVSYSLLILSIYCYTTHSLLTLSRVFKSVLSDATKSIRI